MAMDEALVARLDPGMKALIDMFPPVPDELFDGQDPFAAAKALRGTPVAREPEVDPELDVTSIAIDLGDRTLPVRFYKPMGDGPWPVALNFHGGGWVTGTLDSDDPRCRIIAKQARCAVVSVDYRLAPEHRYPAAIDDAVAALEWVVREAATLNVDPARIAVIGSSAGGNIATALALKTRDTRGPRIAFQWLMYPVLDHVRDTASYSEFRDGPLISALSMGWYWNQYAPAPIDRNDPYLSPLSAKDLTGLPPALIQAAELDPLRDEAENYAARLRDAGVPADLERCKGMTHAFMLAALHIPANRAAFDRGTALLGDVLHA